MKSIIDFGSELLFDRSRVASPYTCPAVTSMASGVPAPSVTMWNFDPNPPRERPANINGMIAELFAYADGSGLLRKTAV